jgi:threonine dehydrogenase-like Zn-dependent dehydrogenase
MKAFCFDGGLKMKELPTPEATEREAVVRVSLAGICNTDVEICAGYMGFQGVLGHEFVGVVERSPDPDLVGKRVVGEINAGCGQCEFCRKGLQRHCSNRTVLGILGRNGAMAEYLALPVENLISVPDNLSDEKAVFVEPLAAALEILEQVKIDPASRALVIGDGKLGLLICMVLRLTGCELTLAGKHPEKSRHFSALGGKVAAPNNLEADDTKFDVVVEASGNSSGWALAIKKVKPRGTIVLKSTYHGALDFNPAPLVIEEITVVGSRCGRFEPALRLMSSGLVDPTPLITAVFPFSEAERAFKFAQEKNTLKALLTF